MTDSLPKRKRKVVSYGEDALADAAQEPASKKSLVEKGSTNIVKDSEAKTPKKSQAKTLKKPQTKIPKTPQAKVPKKPQPNKSIPAKERDRDDALEDDALEDEALEDDASEDNASEDEGSRFTSDYDADVLDHRQGFKQSPQIESAH